MNLKLISNVLFVLSFGCAVLMLTHNTFGYRTVMQVVFLVAGGIALILNLIASRISEQKDDFNLLFWIGSLILFIGFVMRFQSIPQSMFVLIPGLGISAISHFYNPFKAASRREDDDLLDR